ncbi:malto-oligosyltrehalose synthase [Palleronia sediminis]|uniref:Malto-oligosyltrehalose synthase n=1 Tax=Palleronia sediminis TaxID=2547833 RepID=A0A4R6AFY6_9RHOB|nr:malto-oligosyltrehalose synthase [Palleronia sediminis]TDL81348.1 malto-oligosyltrehalose synthase [Palleronia sediminis]
MTFTASYRVQLREGMDFAALRDRLPQIAALGVSHLYLPPILAAQPGSTHGYDVTDPTRIDPALGGRDGFEALSRAARDAGLEIILDIVPNHMAFGLDTPWLVDVLRHGQQSEHAPVFDIDWAAGPLVLPWAIEPLAETAEAGGVAIEGDSMRVGALSLPLAPGTADDATGPLSPEQAETVMGRQAWRLLPWQLERDSITHRRFFSVTGLIGVRVEDAAVFERTHAEVLDLARQGLIHGLRVDHVDGLVDPGGYLERLAASLPDLPIWVEKILVTGETLRDWPVAGTTGYEAAAVIAQSLTDPDGLKVIDALWREATGIEGDFHAQVETAKREMLTDELAAELRQLRGLAEAVAEDEGRPTGPEILREALSELLTAFPRYRSYIGAGADADDRAIWTDSADHAAQNVRLRDEIDWVVARILEGETAPARRLAVRMEQVSGALLAKAHEDTAGFRFNRLLSANEVGADPDRPTARTAEIAAFWSDRQAQWPHALTLGSSHDTKRSEDARARIAAITHAPDAFAALWREAEGLPGAGTLEANRRFYAMQAALALWGAPEAAERVAAHMVKALREGKEVSYWIAPDEALEARMQDWVRALMARWDDTRPPDLLRLVEIGESLSLAELALRCIAPGMPDIYQGGEGAILHLTDPDNRRPPDWAALARLPADDRLADRKARLVRHALALRADAPALFAEGAVEWTARDGSRAMTRRHEGARVAVEIGTGAAPAGMREIWADPGSGAGFPVRLLSEKT